jgi:hypothetical protein
MLMSRSREVLCKRGDLVSDLVSAGRYKLSLPIQRGALSRISQGRGGARREVAVVSDALCRFDHALGRSFKMHDCS